LISYDYLSIVDITTFLQLRYVYHNLVRGDFKSLTKCLEI